MDRNTKGFKIKLNNDAIDQEKQELVNIFLNDKKVKKYILGRNESAQILSKAVDVDGYIDDYTNEKIYLGKQIFKSSEVEKNVIIVSCSLAIYPHSAITSLKKQGIEKVLSYLDVMKYGNNELLTMEFIDNANIDLQQNLKTYEWIASRMIEDESKKVFTDILNFRKNKNLDYMKKYIVDVKGQYFEDFLNFGENEVFVDAGGFDGQTSIEFTKHCQKYKAIYIFEPDSINLKLAKENLSTFKNVNFIAKGLSNQKDTLRFDTGSGSASSISETGNITIEVDTLDNMVEEKVTFIKMDIEGAEGLAIEGMKNHILNDHPKMAISVYHKADDFWKLSKQILDIRDDYDLYMRHYTEGIYETVIFFMPK